MGFISFINFIHHFFSTFNSCFCSHPLFSIFITLYTLVFLYAPSFFLTLLLSPALNSTGIILLFLLKLGANERLIKDLSSQGITIHDSSANERLEKESDGSDPTFLDHKEIHYDKSSNNADDLCLYSSFGLDSTSLEPSLFLDVVDHDQIHKESMPTSSLELESNSQDDCHTWELIDTLSMKTSQVVEKEETRMEMHSFEVDTTIKFLEYWNMKAPLEIIYEAYEGEEEEDEDNNETNMISSDTYVMGCERHPSLSIYYPESETDSSSDDDFPVNKRWEIRESVIFKWEAEEDEKEELIEISLDHYEKRSIEFCQDEEDNLIEIDIFPQEIE